MYTLIACSISVALLLEMSLVSYLTAVIRASVLVQAHLHVSFYEFSVMPSMSFFCYQLYLLALLLMLFLFYSYQFIIVFPIAFFDSLAKP